LPANPTDAKPWSQLLPVLLNARAVSLTVGETLCVQALIAEPFRLVGESRKQS
jgi:hypothetical protein